MPGALSPGSTTEAESPPSLNSEKEKWCGSTSSMSAASVAAALSGQKVCTLMLRNVPLNVSQKRLIEEIEGSGFTGCFDFCYLPASFQNGEGKGYAFVNMLTPKAVHDFVIAWHGSRRLGAHDPAINVSAAELQGRDENIKKWDGPRMRRVRNPALRPHVVDPRAYPGGWSEGAPPGAWSESAPPGGWSEGLQNLISEEWNLAGAAGVPSFISIQPALGNPLLSPGVSSSSS
ncbi:unnamed protein product [Polarella glacialis]|nr:unnamed protein product [Polarella glacialis]